VPPKFGINQGSHLGSAIVTTWGKEFTLDDFEDDKVLGESRQIDDGMMQVEAEQTVTEIAPAADADAMETDPIPNPSVETHLSEIRFKEKKKSSKIVAADRDLVFTAEEMEINPQRMQSLKKMARNRKKAQRKELARQQLALEGDSML
jgi:hypothetical protein